MYINYLYTNTLFNNGDLMADMRRLNEVFYGIAGNGIMTIYGRVGSKKGEKRVILQDDVRSKDYKKALAKWRSKKGMIYNKIK